MIKKIIITFFFFFLIVSCMPAFAEDEPVLEGSLTMQSETEEIPETSEEVITENTTTTINTTSNEEENEVNNLAYTGIEDNSMLVVVILVGAIVAGYSLKKVREYNI